MSRHWTEESDPRSGFVHDETLEPGYVDKASPALPDHLSRLIAHTAGLAQREQAALIERHRKAIEQYEAGVAKKAGEYVRHLTAERWSVDARYGLPGEQEGGAA